MLHYIDKFAGILEIRTSRLLPKTLIAFLLVGSAGVVVHLAILNFALHFITSEFKYANATAMLSAATFNYLLNNKATFHARTLTGLRVVFGYVIYLLITSVGLFTSLLISTWVFDRCGLAMLSALCGIGVGAFWNYFMSYTFVWKLLSRA